MADYDPDDHRRGGVTVDCPCDSRGETYTLPLVRITPLERDWLVTFDFRVLAEMMKAVIAGDKPARWSKRDKAWVVPQGTDIDRLIATLQMVHVGVQRVDPASSETDRMLASVRAESPPVAGVPPQLHVV